jgi:GNAT superfamily N-acetyltransferase
MPPVDPDRVVADLFVGQGCCVLIIVTGGEPGQVGVALRAAAGAGTAEVAVAVADRFRGRGIASLLLQRIAARARGGHLLPDRTVPHVEQRLPAPPKPAGPDDDCRVRSGVVEVRIDLGRAGTAARR